MTRRPRYLLPVEGGHGSVPRTANDDEASGPVIDAPRDKSRSHRRRIADNPVGAVVVLGLALLATIGGAIGAVREIADLFRGSPDRPTGQNLAVRFPASELKLATNRRYGFSFQYPVSWSVRIQPTVMDCARSASRRGSRCSPTALFRSVEFRRRCIRSTRLSGTRVRRPAWYTRRRGSQPAEHHENPSRRKHVGSRGFPLRHGDGGQRWTTRADVRGPTDHDERA